MHACQSRPALPRNTHEMARTACPSWDTVAAEAHRLRHTLCTANGVAMSVRQPKTHRTRRARTKLVQCGGNAWLPPRRCQVDIPGVKPATASEVPLPRSQLPPWQSRARHAHATHTITAAHTVSLISPSSLGYSCHWQLPQLWQQATAKRTPRQTQTQPVLSPATAAWAKRQGPLQFHAEFR